MDDLISRQAAIDTISLFFDKAYIEDADVHKNDALYELNLVPSAEKRGEWIPVTNGRGGHECNQCHEYAPSLQTGEEHLTNYCPHCGARMEKI